MKKLKEIWFNLQYFFAKEKAAFDVESTPMYWWKYKEINGEKYITYQGEIVLKEFKI